MLVLLHATAWAQSLEREPPRLRLSLTGGASARDSTTDDHAVALHYSGYSPTVLHFAGAGFLLRWLGLGLDASYETYVVGNGQDLVPSTVKQRVDGFRLLGELIGRFSPRDWLGVELHLGYGGGSWPAIHLNGLMVESARVPWSGPHAGFAIALEPEGPVGGQLFGRVSLPLTGDLHPLSFSAGGQLHFGNLAVGNLRGAIALDLELIGVVGGGNDVTFTQLQIRTLLGLRLRYQEPAPVVALPPKPEGGTGTTRLKGRVVTNGIGLSGVTVTAGTMDPVKTGEGGVFELANPKPGSILVRAIGEGYKPAEQLVDVKAGEETTVTLELQKPTGPGRIRGIVRGEKEAPVEGADVAIEGGAPVKSGADGSYVLEKAGPGAVKVTVKAKGFQDASDAAQVPPEGIATLDFALVKQGEKQLATIRGLIVKANTGKPVKATVKISELNQTVPVKADGRFVVQVPGGKYTLSIEAPGYVRQEKIVEVADGDQAIFHCDLQPAGR